jgi:Leucine-rich repeat (LRR) protein
LSLIFSLFSSFDFYFLHAGPIPESIGQLQSLTGLRLFDNKLSGAFTNISSGVWDVTSDVPSYFAFIFSGEIPWELLRTLVQEQSLRKLYLGGNKFTVDTIPEIVGTMTKLEALNLNRLGYTGKSGNHQ